MRTTQLRLLLIPRAQDEAHRAQELDIRLAWVGAEGLDECLSTSMFNNHYFWDDKGMGGGFREWDGEGGRT